ncbi:hypothetical protein AAFC00_004692 [Neodothiora populina]|uniref:BZIP domain-containing protein n=1 Tax=Neodothiora populina TaxID=2781224 RepID=A0ABR3P3N3_9PEZI
MGDSIVAANEVATAVAKSDAGQEATPSSLESTPERETEIVQDPAQPQKRKGGRKPIYATSEERKQRNRQAQAAFRERRTEYIKQLETTIKHHEDTLQNLQQSHRSAADECLMLRYKNSLLERILLEKGIDVQAELQLKTGSPALAPAYMPPQPAPGHMVSAPLQRTALNRQHARRAGQPFTQRMAPGSAPQSEISFSARSPQGHPTPSSHASSPAALTQSPASMQQGGMTPPASVIHGQPQHYNVQQQQQQQQQSRPRYVMQHPPSRAAPVQYANASSNMSNQTTPNSVENNGPVASAPSAYYPSPFQKHIEELEQEYDAQPSSILENETEASEANNAHGAEGSHYQNPQYQHRLPPPGMSHSHQQIPGHGQSKAAVQGHERGQASEGGAQGVGMNQIFDPYDPMLDADPFGLSASMHFPTNYSYDQPQQR